MRRAPEHSERERSQQLGDAEMADPTPTPDPTPAPDPAPDPTPTPTDPPANPDEGKGGKDAILADLAKERDKRQGLEQQIADLQAAQQAQLDGLAKALGLKQDDAPPDPARLAEQIAAEQGKTAEAETRASAAERQAAIFRLAALGKHDGNPVALLDSATFLASLRDVDPTDEAAVLDAVTSAIEVNPSLKAAPTAPRFPGGPRISADRPDPGPGLPRLRDAYAQNSK